MKNSSIIRKIKENTRKNMKPVYLQSIFTPNRHIRVRI